MTTRLARRSIANGGGRLVNVHGGTKRTTRVILLIVLVSALVSLLLSTGALASSETFVTSQLTSNMWNHIRPQVSGDRIVWEHGISIFTWTPGGGTVQLPSNSYTDGQPQLSGDRVVWEGYDLHDTEIFTWTPAGGTVQVTSNAYDDRFPQVSGDRIVWVGSDGTDYEIFTWTPSSGTVQLTSNSYYDGQPQLSGDRVVWSGSDGTDYGIFTWTPSSGTVQLTSTSYPVSDPQVSGDRIVWEGYDGYGDIFTWTPMGGTLQLTSSIYYDDVYPKVSGDRIVWVGYDGADHEIFTWTPTGGTLQLASSSNENLYAWRQAQVSGDRVVWNDAEIFTWTPTGGTSQLTSNGYPVGEPQVSGNRIVWSGSDGADYQIFTAVPAVPPPPSISSLDLSTGPATGGSSVVIKGAGFTGASAVKFGSADAISREVDSATKITAVAPAGTEGSTVRVSVTTANGTSEDTAADDYSYASESSTRPLVVLISGLGSDSYPPSEKEEWGYVKQQLSAAHWEFYEAWLKQGGDPNNDLVIDSKSDKWDLAAGQLDEQLWLNYAGRPIILVGHSMGGLIARAYAKIPLGDLTSRCKPAAIIQLGTPNHGSPWGGSGLPSWTGLLGWSATLSLANEKYMANFNKDHKNSQLVPVYCIAGFYFGYPALNAMKDDKAHSVNAGTYSKIINKFNGLYSDAMVDTGSALAWNAEDGELFKGVADWVSLEFAVHPPTSDFDVVISSAELDRIRPTVGLLKPGDKENPNDQAVVSQILKFLSLAESGQGQEKTAATSAPSRAVAAPAQTQKSLASVAATATSLARAPGSTCSQTGTVSLASGNVEVPFITEGTSLRATAISDEDGLTLALRDAEGGDVASDVTGTGTARDLSADGLVAGGQYVLVVGATGGHPAKADIDVCDAGPSSLRVFAPDQAAAGGSFDVHAAVYESDYTSSPVIFDRSTLPLTVTATLADGAPVILHDDGVSPDETASDGIFAAAFSAPEAGSSISLVVRASGADSSGVAFQRVDTKRITIAEPRAALSGTTTYHTETDGNGKVAALIVDVPVSASEACALHLSGDITSAGEVVGQTSADATLAAGEGTVTLRFSAADIYPRLDASGAFSVSRLTLLDITDTDQAVLEEQTDVLFGTLERETLTYAGSSLSLSGINPAATHDLQLTGSSSSTGEAVAGVEYSIDKGDWTALSDPSASWGGSEVSWDLPLALPDGIHGVSVRATDAEGTAISGTDASVSFVVDTTAPWGTLVVSRGSDAEKPLDVVAASSLTDLTRVIDMRFSLDGSTTWSDWESYADAKNLALPAGGGIKVVIAQFRDEAGNVAQLCDSVTLMSLGAGWNLVAGGPGSDFPGQVLFGYGGATYQSVTAGAMVAGSGYWCRMAAAATAYSNTTEAPITCHLQVGWNLVGNSSGVSVGLPAGFTAFAYDGVAYRSTSVLAPGEGAWVRATTGGDLVLEAAE